MENGDWPSGPDYDELYTWYEGWHSDAEAYYYDDDHNGEQGEWQEPWYEAGYHEEPADAEEETPAEPSNNMDESYYKGKGKSRTGSMGLGCSTCGSKWHSIHSCPLNSQSQSKGYGKSKGFGKNFGRPMRKGFGKGKYKAYGKGKGNPYKGYGKRSFWSDDLPQSFGDYYG